MDSARAIENQLHTPKHICSARRVSTGITCSAPAVAVAKMRAIDERNQMGLSPDSDLVERICQACPAAVQWAMAICLGRRREMAPRCGTHRVCTTSGRPTRYLRSVFAVHLIRPEVHTS
jgi:hypothetical protein